jgi:ATP-dependent RNA helicase DeaD
VRSERGERSERPARQDRPSHGGKGDHGDEGDGAPRAKREHKSDAGQATLFFSLGQSAGIRPQDLLGMVYREAELPDNSVGTITIFPRHSLMNVEKNHVDQILKALSQSKLRGQRFKIGLDKKG